GQQNQQHHQARLPADLRSPARPLSRPGCRPGGGRRQSRTPQSHARAEREAGPPAADGRERPREGGGQRRTPVQSPLGGRTPPRNPSARRPTLNPVTSSAPSPAQPPKSACTSASTGASAPKPTEMQTSVTRVGLASARRTIEVVHGGGRPRRSRFRFLLRSGR